MGADRKSKMVGILQAGTVIEILETHNEHEAAAAAAASSTRAGKTRTVGKQRVRFDQRKVGTHCC
jgi:hypothetical protein